MTCFGHVDDNVDHSGGGSFLLDPKFILPSHNQCFCIFPRKFVMPRLYAHETIQELRISHYSSGKLFQGVQNYAITSNGVQKCDLPAMLRIGVAVTMLKRVVNPPAETI